MQELEIRPMRPSDLPEVKKFSDRWIGKDYFGQKDLEQCLQKSELNGAVASFVAVAKVSGELAGIRITFAPGTWLDSSRGASVDEWNCDPSSVGYFKSLFIAKEFQKRGIGKKLSQKSLEVLRLMGAKAVVCHSWLESPGNSSQLYLQSMGFRPVKTHPNYWSDVSYFCSGCGKDQCVCTAVEMIKDL